MVSEDTAGHQPWFTRTGPLNLGADPAVCPVFLHRPEDSSMTHMRHPSRSLVALGFAGVMLLAACGSSGSAKAGSAPSTTAPPATSATTGATTSTSAAPKSGGVDVDVTTTPLGLTLVDSSGHTLYQYKPDPNGKSTCTGACATVWPPLTVSGTVTVAANLPLAQFATIAGPGGTQIITDAGHPLYRFSGDKKPGDTNGEGVGGVWHAAGPIGNTM
jgi:predicted lipoprotein with Yx(FWY)xxD motif